MHSMFQKPPEQILEADLQELIDNGVLEQRSLEYKAALPGHKDSDKIEFLADVSSLANSDGGDIVYGLSCNKDGTPAALCGIDSDNLDQAILRLDSIVRDGLSPRLVRPRLRAIPLQSGKHALLLRIDRSWSGPHMIAFQRNSRFFVRNAAGKHIMDATELRAAFMTSTTARQAGRAWRDERLAHLRQNSTSTLLALHIYPLRARDEPLRLTPRDCAGIATVEPLGGHIRESRHNFDGYRTSAKWSRAESYFQLYRSGAIEGVNTDVAYTDQNLGRSCLSTPSIERFVNKASRDWVGLLRHWGIDDPLLLSISILRTTNLPITNDPMLIFHEVPVIDASELLFPEIEIEAGDQLQPSELQRLWDMLWNAGGFEKRFERH